MTALLRFKNKIADFIIRNSDRFAYYHPYLAFALSMIIAPLIILAAVSVFASLSSVIIAFFAGWL